MTVDLRSKIREVPDFPTPGVGFKDFTPLLADPQALRETVDQLATWVKEKDCDIVIGAEARGFILGAAIAAQARQEIASKALRMQPYEHRHGGIGRADAPGLDQVLLPLLRDVLGFVARRGEHRAEGPAPERQTRVRL